MKGLDRFIQRWRMRQAMRFIPAGSRVIDVGAHEGELFRALGKNLGQGYGIEPLCPTALTEHNFTVVAGFFPAVRPAEGGWDAVTMLAVLEHVPTREQPALAASCHALLKPGGRMLYCTCSVFRREGQAQVKSFLQHNTQAHGLPCVGHLLPQNSNNNGGVTDNLPSDHDGFFYALLQKPLD